MTPNHSDADRMQSLNLKVWPGAFIVAAVFCAILAAASLFSAAAGDPGAIPAWLDEAITQWNQANPASPIQFVSIKDSYVWYAITPAPQFGSKDIRERVYGIAYKNGYVNKQDEEMVTTARPPAQSGTSRTLKCWTRSFLRSAQKGSTGPSGTMLTTLVCEDGAGWSAGFRVLQ